MSSPDQVIDEQLKKLTFQLNNKQWHEFGENILSFVFKFDQFDCTELIHAVSHQLNTKLDIYIVLQLLEVYIQRENVDREQAFELLENQRPLTKGSPQAGLYIDLAKVKIYMKAGQLEEGIKLLNETEEKLKQHRTFPKILYSIINEVKCLYYWQREDFKLFNEVIQKYLAYTDLEKLNS